MANLNKVLLMGNITKDPQLSYLPSQTAVCEFGLAVNRTWTGQDGVKKEEVTFVDCSCFGKTAEILAKYKKKGDPLFIEGRLKLDMWEAQDGSKRSKMRVVVENFQFLNRSQGMGANQAGGGGPGGPPQMEDDTGGGGGGGYAPQAQPYAQPQQAARQPYRQAGRPAAAPPAQRPQQAPPPAPAPNYDSDGPSPDDAQPPMGNEEIPF